MYKRQSLVVLNKVELVAEVPPRLAGHPVHSVSAATGAGLGPLLEAVAAAVDRRYAPGAAPALTRARHRTALEDCAGHIDRALSAPLPELAAEDVRLAVRALGRITGRVDVEDLLDVIFRDFCIGK